MYGKSKGISNKGRAMNFDNIPLAAVTVHFPDLVSGKTVLGLVQSVVWSQGSGYVEERRYFDGEAVIPGRSGLLASEHIAVVRSYRDPSASFFSEIGDTEYGSVIVVNHGWAGRQVYGVDYPETIRSVRKFASLLEEAAEQAFTTHEFPVYKPGTYSPW